MMTMTPPPPWLTKDPEALACFHRVQQRLRARGEWRPEYALGLAPTATQCASYLGLARAVRAQKNITRENMEELEIELERTHRLAREGLIDFWVLDPARSALAPLNAEGLDAEIAALCAPLDGESA